MGSEDWAVKRVWVCVIPKPAGTVSFYFYVHCFSSLLKLFNLSRDFLFQDAQSAINDLTGKYDSVIHILPLQIRVFQVLSFMMNFQRLYNGSPPDLIL